MKIYAARDFAAESHTKFKNLLDSLAEEHHRLCSFTQNLVTQLKLDNEDASASPRANGKTGSGEIVNTLTLAEKRGICLKALTRESGGGSDFSGHAVATSRACLKPRTPVTSDCLNRPAKPSTPRPRAHSVPHTPSDSEEDEVSLVAAESGRATPKVRISKRYGADRDSQWTSCPTLNQVHPSVLLRLQARLGVVQWRSPVSHIIVLNAARTLGLEKYTACDLQKLIARMVAVSDQENDIRTERVPASPASRVLKRLSSTTNALRLRSHDDLNDPAISLKKFAEYLVSDAARARLGPDCEEICTTLKEVLLSGDANRLVAELTSVRVDDLATPQPNLDWDMLFEPIIAAVILLNGISIGIQTDESFGEWKGWIWIEASFTLFFLVEMLLRLYFYGPRSYFLGPEKAWSFLDVFIVTMGTVDFIMALSQTGVGVGSLTIIRTCRILRIARLFRIFRLSFLRELTIMVRGLLAGMKTLAWAVVLLFFTIYLIAVLATYTIGADPKDNLIAAEELFASVPRSMVTCFRCFVGDCNTKHGASIVKLLSDAQGPLFVLGYLASFIIVTLGLFNLIAALYVDITLEAAKRTEDLDKKRQKRESLRIARCTKKLLKKFCVAQLLGDPRQMPKQEISQILKASDDMDLDSHMTVSKELFLLIVQDQEVQALMNDLDIPPDRANLFEVLDADGTGDLHVTELVHGLLKVRGEARKSDIVASLLAVRAVQDMLRLFEKKVLSNQKRIMEKMGIKRQIRATSIWDSYVRATSTTSTVMESKKTSREEKQT